MAVSRPVVLAILDGWGEQPRNEHNAIALARTPVWDRLTAKFPKSLINASEMDVGLPEGQMGNSEVGHMNIGSGRVVMQDLPRIDEAIRGDALARDAQLAAFIARLKQSGGACHLMGLLSPGGVHAHQAHMAYLARVIAEAGVKVYVHAFLDGRDTPPRSACEYIPHFEDSLRAIAKNHTACIATLSGRYYAMDRDQRWERVKLAYETIAEAKGSPYRSASEAIEASYAAGKTDEFVLPRPAETYPGMKDGDGLLMTNFRADRAREILTALLDPAFDGFPRRAVNFAGALGLVEYSEALSAWMGTIFPPQSLTNILGEVVSQAGLKQLRVAETEKYAHVTFFFNGGREEPFPGEERILIPSPKVATYDLKPEMSAPEVTEALLAAMDAHDLIVVNFANTDMVGHTGDLQAAIKAVEAVDACLGRISEAVLKRGGAMLVTADHGNAEAMHDHDTGQAHTAHTLSLVPALLVSERHSSRRLRDGRLADIAPTLLELLELPQPTEMTGRSLIVHEA